MKGASELSPLGTACTSFGAAGARHSDNEQEAALLEWLRAIGEKLELHYSLESEVAFVAWELAHWQPDLQPVERRSLILLILAALVQMRLGSTRLNVAEQLAGFVEAAAGWDASEAGREADRIEALLATGRIETILGRESAAFKPLVLLKGHLYLQRMLHLENEFVAAIKERCAATIPRWTEKEIESALSDVLKRPTVRGGRPVALTEEQREAVRAAVRAPLTIISGGPGTGKTTVVVSILRVLLRLGVASEDFALAAPTGRAANRLGEAIRFSRAEIADPAPADRDLAGVAEPRTLHRLLGYSPAAGSFLHHRNNRLAERVVIVDEASMIDLALMERLVRCLRDDSQLVLLGDADQLPSVDAGAVLRDLLAVGQRNRPRSPQTKILVESYRMRPEDDDGRNLLTVARAIDQGNLPDFAPSRTSDNVAVQRASASEVVFRGVEFLESGENSKVLDEFLERWHSELEHSLSEFDNLATRDYALVDGAFRRDDQEQLGKLFECWEESRILCVTRVLSTGSERINAALHERLRDLLFPRHNEDELIPGEPVMMQVNDYRRMIFNGDFGLILKVADRARPQPMAVFRRSDGFAAFHLDSLRPSLQLSYAVTVHKAQGSEFGRVAIVLPECDVPINTREVLYTALSRARTGALLVGSRDVFRKGVERTITRDSGIVEKLLDLGTV